MLAQVLTLLQTFWVQLGVPCVGISQEHDPNISTLKKEAALALYATRGREHAQTTFYPPSLKARERQEN